jgi:hypothetical protein
MIINPEKNQASIIINQASIRVNSCNSCLTRLKMQAIPSLNNLTFNIKQ